MENKDGDTHVSESQVIVEEVLFELGQPGSANPHRRPSLTEQQYLIHQRQLPSVTASKHFQKGRTAPKEKALYKVCKVVPGILHTAKPNSPALYTCICFLSHNIPAVFI